MIDLNGVGLTTEQYARQLAEAFIIDWPRGWVEMGVAEDGLGGEEGGRDGRDDSEGSERRSETVEIDSLDIVTAPKLLSQAHESSVRRHSSPLPANSSWRTARFALGIESTQKRCRRLPLTHSNHPHPHQQP